MQNRHLPDLTLERYQELIEGLIEGGVTNFAFMPLARDEDLGPTVEALERAGESARRE